MSKLSKDQLSINLFVKIGVLVILITTCFYLVWPFMEVFLWGGILAVALSPLYKKILEKVKGRKKTAALLVILMGLVIITIPAFIFTDSVIESAETLKGMADGSGIDIPDADESVKDWPFVGDYVYQFWDLLASNTEDFAVKYKDQIRDVGAAVVQTMLSIGSIIFQFILSTIIAGVLLAYPGTKDFGLKLFSKLAGRQGEMMVEIVDKTISSVIKGVLGVALIQAFIIGLGFVFAGVPYAGLWAFLVFLLGVFQLPPMIIVIPVILYLFSIMDGLYAGLWAVYLILGGLVDNVIKPFILAAGAPVPMLVIFLGVLGGFIAMGFIGLFLGAIILSIGYELFRFWLESQDIIEQTD